MFVCVCVWLCVWLCACVRTQSGAWLRGVDHIASPRESEGLLQRVETVVIVIQAKVTGCFLL